MLPRRPLHRTEEAPGLWPRESLQLMFCISFLPGNSGRAIWPNRRCRFVGQEFDSPVVRRQMDLGAATVDGANDFGFGFRHVVLILLFFKVGVYLCFG